MMKRSRLIVTLAGLLLAALAITPVVWSQPAPPYFFATTPGGTSQFNARVNTGTTPMRTEVGCESERTGAGSVNGLRLAGGTAGNPVTLTAFPCTGGDANIGISLIPAGTGGVTFTGTGTILSHVTFFAANEACFADNALLINTRIAAGDFALARTATGAETYNVNCTFKLPFQTATNKGARIDSVSISYQVTVVALTSHTFSNIRTRTFANNVANALANYAGGSAATLATATQANPYFTAVTITTPVFMNTANTEVNIEWQVVLANTGVYRVYGIQVNWSQAIF